MISRVNVGSSTATSFASFLFKVPQLCSGQKPTPKPSPIIFRTTEGLSLSKITCGLKPCSWQRSSQRVRKLLVLARQMKRSFLSVSSGKGDVRLSCAGSARHILSVKRATSIKYSSLVDDGFFLDVAKVSEDEDVTNDDVMGLAPIVSITKSLVGRRSSWLTRNETLGCCSANSATASITMLEAERMQRCKTFCWFVAKDCTSAARSDKSAKAGEMRCFKKIPSGVRRMFLPVRSNSFIPSSSSSL